MAGADGAVVASWPQAAMSTAARAATAPVAMDRGLGFADKAGIEFLLRCSSSGRADARPAGRLARQNAAVYMH
jgi:hypothetical protein